MKAVIFDMDGVLVDSEPKNLEQLKLFMESYDIVVEDAFLTSLVGASYSKTCNDCTSYMKKDWTNEQFLTYFNDFIKHHPYRFRDIQNPHVKKILQWLRANGYKTAVASSSLLTLIDEMEEDLELVGLFDTKVSGEMFEESKPHPDIYLHTAKALCVTPEECVAVEDSEYGIEAALRAGMQVLAYRDERYGVNQSKATAMINDLEGVVDWLEKQASK